MSPFLQGGNVPALAGACVRRQEPVGVSEPRREAGKGRFRADWSWNLEQTAV